MTFIDAAVAILREFGRPLHYKKIAELAVERGLLSHVGKTPEVTMEVRLKQEADKGDGSSIRCVRRGVFALADESERRSESAVRAAKPDAVPARRPVRAQTDHVEGAPRSRTRQRRQSHGETGAEAKPTAAGRAPSRLRAHHVRRRAAPEVPQLVPTGADQPALPDALTHVLAASGGPLSVAELAHRLSSTKLALASPGVVENAIHTENRRRLGAGKPPRFVRTSEGWLLGSESLLQPLVDSYAALEHARIDLDRAVSAALEQAISMLEGRSLEAFVTGVLEEQGFSPNLVDRDARLTTWEVTSTRGLIPLKVVVCLWHAVTAIGASAITGLRERVRRARATHGLLLALNRQEIDATARREIESSQLPPIALFDAAALAARALEVGIGVVRVPTGVPVLDANWFGHLEDG